jgi:hypothetical protein
MTRWLCGDRGTEECPWCLFPHLMAWMGVSALNRGWGEDKESGSA